MELVIKQSWRLAAYLKAPDKLMYVALNLVLAYTQ